MPKMIIKLRDGIKEENFKNGDMLVYDSTKREFYAVTEKDFFDKTNSKINQLIKKYDLIVKELKEENKSLKEENKEFMLKIQESNQKLIEMVDSFIKGGK